MSPRKLSIAPLAVAFLLATALCARHAIAVPVSAPDTQARTGEPKAAPPPDLVAALVSTLGADDAQAREAATRELIKLGEGARTALRKALLHRDPEVRWRALYALSLLDFGIARAHTDPARTLYASAARARRRPDAQDAARALYAEVVKRFPGTRWAQAAAERLDALRRQRPARPAKPPTQEQIRRLVARLASPSWAVRQDASRQLAAIGVPARKALQAAADSNDPETAWRARNLLDRLKPSQAEPKPATPAAPRVRFSIRPPGAPGRLLREDDHDGLVRALAASDADEVAHAREILANLAWDAVPALIRGLDGADETTAVEIIDLLRQITAQRLPFDPDAWRRWWRARQQREGD